MYESILVQGESENKGISLCFCFKRLTPICSRFINISINPVILLYKGNLFHLHTFIHCSLIFVEVDSWVYNSICRSRCFECLHCLPARIACSSFCSFQNPADEFLLYSHIDRHSRLWIRSPKTFTCVFTFAHWNGNVSLFFCVFASLYIIVNVLFLRTQPTLNHPLSFTFVTLSHL